MTNEQIDELTDAIYSELDKSIDLINETPETIIRATLITLQDLKKLLLTSNETEQTNIQGSKRFYELVDEIKELHRRKSHDYSGAVDPLKNLRLCEDIGISPFKGILVRIGDKWSRIQELSNDNSRHLVEDESIYDTLRDLVVYSLLAIVVLEERKKKNFSGENIP